MDGQNKGYTEERDHWIESGDRRVEEAAHRKSQSQERMRKRILNHQFLLIPLDFTFGQRLLHFADLRDSISFKISSESSILLNPFPSSSRNYFPLGL